jgi:prevent-host-death family protein
MLIPCRAARGLQTKGRPICVPTAEFGSDDRFALVVIGHHNVVTNVSVRDLKANLSRYLKEAMAGRDIIVTSRGRRLVRLLPIPERQEPTREELLGRLRLVPGVQPGSVGKPQGAKKPLRIGAGQKSLAEIVIEDRG